MKKKKNIAAVISVIVAVAAGVMAAIVFHRQIAAFIESLKAKFKTPADPPAPQPDFTEEEREAFADI